MGFLPWEDPVALPGECQLRQSRATQPTVNAGGVVVVVVVLVIKFHLLKYGDICHWKSCMVSLVK